MFCGVVISVSMRESGRGGKISGKSSSSENSQTQIDEAKKGLSPLEARAKKMRYINIEFSDDDG
jgi:hypothetical protein